MRGLIALNNNEDARGANSRFRRDTLMPIILTFSFLRGGWYTHSRRATWLAIFIRLTVARQRRTYTGFAIAVLTIRDAGHLDASSIVGMRLSQTIRSVKKAFPGIVRQPY